MVHKRLPIQKNFRAGSCISNEKKTEIKQFTTGNLKKLDKTQETVGENNNKCFTPCEIKESTRKNNNGTRWKEYFTEKELEELENDFSGKINYDLVCAEETQILSEQPRVAITPDKNEHAHNIPTFSDSKKQSTSYPKTEIQKKTEHFDLIPIPFYSQFQGLTEAKNIQFLSEYQKKKRGETNKIRNKIGCI